MGKVPFGSRISSRQLCSRVGASTLRRQGLGRLQWAHCTELQVCSTCRQSPRHHASPVAISTSCWACSARLLLTVQRLDG